ncbi:MAG TPA: autotransporter-associated beta strand repeat-containing protein [Gemmataceae bacterium]|nr:autotransporter-associated beta strand repeat-containing protein [Gemmataceae bacterium]
MFSFRNRPKSRVSRRPRLSLEPLETRLTPSTTDYWIGTDGNSWSDPLNWRGGTPQPGDTLVFDYSISKYNYSTDDLQTFTNHSFGLQFQGTESGGNAFLIDGQGDDFTSVTSEAAGSDPIQFAMSTIYLEGDTTISVSGSEPLALHSQITQLLSSGLIKDGSGALYLDGGSSSSANNYSGTTQVKDGTLYLGASASQVQVPAALKIGDGTGAAGSAQVVIEANSQIASTSAVTINSDGQLTLQPEVSQTVASMTGTGAISLESSSTPAVLTIGGDASNQFTGSLEGSGTLVKLGKGTLSLGSANANFTGQLDVDQGTLAASNAQALGASGSAVVVAAGATLELSGSGTAMSFTAGSLTFEGGSSSTPGVLWNQRGNNTWTGTVSLANSATLNVSSNTSLTLDGVIGGSSGFTKIGAGTLVLAGSDSYTGATKVNQGTLIVATDTAVTSSSGTTVVSGATLELPGGIQVGDEPLTLGGRGINGKGALVSLSGSEAGLTSNSWAGPITLAGKVSIAAASGSQLTLDGVLSGGSLISMIGSSSSLTLNAVNTYTGGTEVQSGVLTVDGSIGSVIVDSGAGLTGEGTTGNVTVRNGGQLEGGFAVPGLSSGLRTGTVSLGASSSFKVSIMDAAWEQVSVTGQLNLNNAHLQIDTAFAALSSGEQIVLIQNDGSDAIKGTFTDDQGKALTEGSTITIGSFTFTISYQGGTGNDVVLTVA